MAEIVNIDEGYTLDYLIPAFFILMFGPLITYFDFYQGHFFFNSFGAVVTFVIYTISFLLFLIGILLLMVKSGVQIDYANRRIRVYKSISKWMIGNWVDISSLVSLKLEFTNESIHMMSRGTEKTYRTKTYDLFLESVDGQFMLFHCFDKKALAYRTIKRIQAVSKTTFTDRTKKII